jgi:hypothetical protein
MCQLLPSYPGYLATALTADDLQFFAGWAAFAENDMPSVWLGFGDFGSPGEGWGEDVEGKTIPDTHGPHPDQHSPAAHRPPDQTSSMPPRRGRPTQ